MIKRIISILICVSVLLCGASCGKEAKQTTMPDDFSFSIVWNVFGISSYDSKTGKLVKTKDATDINKYTTYLNLTEEELNNVYRLLFVDIDITEYPDTYDPFNNSLGSDPDDTIVITATANGRTKTVTCEHIAPGTVDDCYCDEARAFWTVKDEIVDMITSSPEWEALPELEFFYD